MCILHWGLFKVTKVTSLNRKRWKEMLPALALTDAVIIHTPTRLEHHTRKHTHRLLANTPSQHRDTDFVNAHRHTRVHTCAYTLGHGDTYACTYMALLVETPERQVTSLGECGEGQGWGPSLLLPHPGGHSQSHQTNSLHTEQNVGCPKKVAMNSWCLM